MKISELKTIEKSARPLQWVMVPSLVNETYPLVRSIGKNMKGCGLSGLIFALLMLSGCAAKRGYTGPTLADEKIARVYFQSDKGVQLSRLSVDGHSLSAADEGIEVLPGAHEAAAEFSYEESICEKSKPCSTRDVSGMCRATVRAKSGRAYVFKVTPDKTEINVTVVDYDAQTPSGDGSCTVYAQGITLR